MSYRSRVYRQRNAHQNEGEQSKDQDKFFSRSPEKSKVNASKASFFQAKPTDAAKGADDALEKEANQSANKMANPDLAKDKKDEAIQRLATPEEDKKTSTNDERQKNDKDKQA